MTTSHPFTPSLSGNALPDLHLASPIITPSTAPDRQSRFDQMPTTEELYRQDLHSLHLEAAFTTLPALGCFVSHLANKVLSMVSQSNKSEYRGMYGILRDYTKERDVISACNTLHKAITRYSDAMQTQVQRFKSVSGVISAHNDEPSLDLQIMSRLDESDAIFAADYEAIRREIVAQFRPIKCYDPQMLYPLINAIFMADRFRAIALYFTSLCTDELSGSGMLASITRLNVSAPLIQLAHRLNLTDKAGRPIHFIFDRQEQAEYERLSQKRSFQIKHRNCPPLAINVMDILGSDAMLRQAWRLETHMLEISTIDRIITASSGYDPRYRDDYSFRRLQSCSNTFEQANLNRVISTHRWSLLPECMRSFLDSLAHRPVIDPRRRPKPVVGFKLTVKYDAKGNILWLRPGHPDYNCTFMGIWHSSYEAEHEMGISHTHILRSVRCKAINDGHNHVWLSLPDYLKMTYKTLSNVHPDIAARFLQLVPEVQAPIPDPSPRRG